MARLKKVTTTTNSMQKIEQIRFLQMFSGRARILTGSTYLHSGLELFGFECCGAKRAHGNKILNDIKFITRLVLRIGRLHIVEE